MWPTVSLKIAGSRSNSMTLPPSAQNSSPMVAPIPRPPPVTMAVFPFMRTPTLPLPALVVPAIRLLRERKSGGRGRLFPKPGVAPDDRGEFRRRVGDHFQPVGAESLYDLR